MKILNRLCEKHLLFSFEFCMKGDTFDDPEGK